MVWVIIRVPITDYDTAIRLKPDHATRHTTIAELRRTSSVNTFAAIADYDTAIRLKT